MSESRTPLGLLIDEAFEVRMFSEFELREAVPEGDPSAQGVLPTDSARGGRLPQLVGMVSRFNSLSEDLGGFRERVSQEAFRKTLKEQDIVGLVNHDPNMPLARTSNGTLQLRETRDGLACQMDLPNTSYARDLIENIQRGNIKGMSFGFRTIRDDWAMEANENVRVLKEVQLRDVSPVTFPAYTSTDVAMRSLSKFRAMTAAPAQEDHAAAAFLLTRAGPLAETMRMRMRLLEQSVR